MKTLFKKNTTARRTKKLGLGTSLSIAIAITTASPAAAQVPTGISSLNATYQKGTSSSYSTTVADPCIVGDYPGGCNSNINMQFGDGATNDLTLSGFKVGADNYSLVQLADEVGFRRINGQGATGERNLVLFEYNARDKIRTSYTNTLAGAMLGTTINRGVDNGFSNDNSVASNNIERIDYIIKTGLSVPGVSANNIGFLVLERGGNDPFQIAAITSLDASGKPNGFGPLRRIEATTWGKSSFNINTAVMRREENEPAFRPSHLVGSQTISGVYTSIASLGLADGQTFYGYALFPNDISATNDLVNLTDFPKNTSGESGQGGLDLMAGGGIFLKDGLTTISGTLYEDTDGNNNLGGSEPKLPAGITVRLLNNNNQQIATATTDSNGAYKFVGIANGNYKIQVDTTDTDIPNRYTLGTPNNLTVNVTGNPVTNQNFGFDVRAYTVSGTVYEDFGTGGANNNNNKFDSGEKTIGKVTVNLFNDDGQPDGAAVKTIETNATGAYQFTDVAPGRYIIRVDTRDTDIPSTYAIGTPNPIKINVTADVTNQNFGFNTVSKTCPAGSFLPEQTFLNFQNPQLESGSALTKGAVYRFSNVATDIDALVEIKSLNNTTLTQIDVNDSGVQSAFQPEVKANFQNAGNYSVDFDINFVQSGTTTRVELRKVLATGIDIDGDEVRVREASELGGNEFTSYAIDSKSRLTATKLSPTRVKFESTTTFNLEGITINSLNQGSVFYDKNTQSIEYRAGLIIDPGSATNIATQRLTSLVFDCVQYNLAVTSNPNVILVKRITAINRNRNQNPNDGTVLNQFVDDTTSSQQNNDNSPNWPDNYLLGAIDAGKVKREDEIEYTVYFLNIGNANASNVRLCDRITANQNFQPNTYAAGRGIQLKLGNSAQTSLTNANDTVDRAQLIAAGGTVPANCNLKGVNTNGTVQIDITGNTGSPSLTTMPGSTGKGTPNNSYGLFRFTTKVQP